MLLRRSRRIKKGERNSLALCVFFLKTALGFRLLSPQIINGHKPRKHHEDYHAPLGERGDGRGGGGRTTVKVAMAGSVLLPLLVCKAPAASVLMKLPPQARSRPPSPYRCRHAAAGRDRWPPSKVTDDAVQAASSPATGGAASEPTVIARPPGNCR